MHFTAKEWKKDKRGETKDRFNIIKIHGADLNVSYVTFASWIRQGWPINAVCCRTQETPKGGVFDNFVCPIRRLPSCHKYKW